MQTKLGIQEKPEHEDVIYSEHDLKATFIDKGHFESPLYMQKLKVSYMPPENELTQKFSVTITADNGVRSFRSDNRHILMNLIIRLSVIYAKMFKEDLKDSDMAQKQEDMRDAIITNINKRIREEIHDKYGGL